MVSVFPGPAWCLAAGELSPAPAVRKQARARDGTNPC